MYESYTDIHIKKCPGWQVYDKVFWRFRWSNKKHKTEWSFIVVHDFDVKVGQQIKICSDQITSKWMHKMSDNFQWNKLKSSNEISSVKHMRHWVTVILTPSNSSSWHGVSSQRPFLQNASTWDCHTHACAVTPTAAPVGQTIHVLAMQCVDVVTTSNTCFLHFNPIHFVLPD